jgi:hypothetical protein
MFEAFGEERVRGKQTNGKELHKESFNLYFSPNVIKVINLRGGGSTVCSMRETITCA